MSGNFSKNIKYRKKNFNIYHQVNPSPNQGHALKSKKNRALKFSDLPIAQRRSDFLESFSFIFRF